MSPEPHPTPRPTEGPRTNIPDRQRTHLLFGFGGVTLDRLSGHQALQRVLHSAYLVGLDVQLQGEEGLQGGRLF